MAGWKASRDPLFRGDGAGGVCLPTPAADDSIVRHLLYLDGAGRQTPYLSTTEDRAVAERFAGASGQVYATAVPTWAPRGVAHVPRTELLQNLKGKGKGRAAWPSALEVMQARRYVEESAEHLADFRGVDSADLNEVCGSLFSKAGR